jgi:hypothetical protein
MEKVQKPSKVLFILRHSIFASEKSPSGTPKCRLAFASGMSNTSVAAAELQGILSFCAAGIAATTSFELRRLLFLS